MHFLRNLKKKIQCRNICLPVTQQTGGVGWGAVFYVRGGVRSGKRKPKNVEILLGVCVSVLNSPSNLT